MSEHGPIICVVGARPNFMKIAPIIDAFRTRRPPIPTYLVHTGQHYDRAMNRQFFDELDIPMPEIDLEVGSGSHAVQTAEIMKRFEPVVDERDPSAVLVVGDVNSTIACALVAVKKGVPVVHVEAGLRSGDRAMPEEINRVLTDQISEVLFTTEPDAEQNLAREGIDSSKVFFVGNVMIDSLIRNRDRAIPVDVTIERCAKNPAALDLTQGFGLVTLHRPSNVDQMDILRKLLEVLRDISIDLPLIFPVHPRTRGRIDEMGGSQVLEGARILELPPVGYLEMVGLLAESKVVLTDSGGLQEESTALGIPCITMRDTTERPITVSQGTNTVVGSDPGSIRRTFAEVLRSGGKRGRVPDLWDGRAAERIADVIERWLHRKGMRAA